MSRMLPQNGNCALFSVSLRFSPNQQVLVTLSKDLAHIPKTVKNFVVTEFDRKIIYKVTPETEPWFQRSLTMKASTLVLLALLGFGKLLLFINGLKRSNMVSVYENLKKLVE